MDMANTIVTESYKLSPAVYLHATLHSMLPKLAAILCLPTAICFISALWEPRMMLVAMIFIFIIAPMVLAHIYFSKMLTKEACEALSTKHVEITPAKQIRIIYEGTGESPVPSPVTIAWDDIISCSLSQRHITIYHSNRQQPLIIPLDSLPPHFDAYVFCCHEGDDYLCPR